MHDQIHHPDPTGEPLRILVAERDARTRVHLERILSGRGYDVDTVTTAEEVLRRLPETSYDTILLGWSLPDMPGLEALRHVRSRFAMHDLPVVMVSSAADADQVVQAFDRGANDVLSVPLHPGVTLVRVHNLVVLRRTRLELRRQAWVDWLTGLYNRHYIMEQLARQIAQARRYGREFAFCLCDIDHFKAINDTFGHQAGDQALVAFARVLRGRLRASDVIGRFGGDELCILFPETPVQGARVATEAVRVALQQLGLTAGGRSYGISASFGVAGLDADTIDPAALVGRADEALYMAKRQGRNTTVVAKSAGALPLALVRARQEVAPTRTLPLPESSVTSAAG